MDERLVEGQTVYFAVSKPKDCGEGTIEFEQGVVEDISSGRRYPLIRTGEVFSEIRTPEELFTKVEFGEIIKFVESLAGTKIEGLITDILGRRRLTVSLFGGDHSQIR